MTRTLATLVVTFYFGLTIFAATTREGIDVASARTPQPLRTVVNGRQVAFNGHGPEWWARQAHRWHKAYTRTRRSLLASASTREAINLACATYGYCSTLWRTARCESGLSPYAKNPWSDASGLFQFLPSTFASTPFASLSIWSPYANAMAAGWMRANGRGGEWVCQ